MSRKKMFLAFAIFTALANAVAAHEYKPGGLQIDHPWMRAPAASATMTAAYLTISNTGRETDRLIGGSVSIAASFELHESTVSDGISRMRRVEGGVAVMSGKSVRLEPGGLHIMLTGLTRVPAKGERVAGTLNFERAGPVNVEFAVEGVEGPQGRHHE